MTIAATDEAEGAQAMFCYIADRLGAFQTKKQFTPYMSSKDSNAFFKEYGDIIKEGHSHYRLAECLYGGHPGTSYNVT